MRNFHTVFHGSRANSHSRQQWSRAPFSPQPLQHLLSLAVLTVAPRLILGSISVRMWGTGVVAAPAPPPRVLLPVRPRHQHLPLFRAHLGDPWAQALQCCPHGAREATVSPSDISGGWSLSPTPFLFSPEEALADWVGGHLCLWAGYPYLLCQAPRSTPTAPSCRQPGDSLAPEREEILLLVETFCMSYYVWFFSENNAALLRGCCGCCSVPGPWEIHTRTTTRLPVA